jgi:hypothetical protein
MIKVNYIDTITTTVRENLAVTTGIIIMVSWITMFTVGLFVDSSYYRAAITYGFADWTDWMMSILSFTLSNVALLAFLAGFLGGLCSKIIATKGYTLTKRQLELEGVDYVLFENPFISAFRGVFMFLTVLSFQYLSSFSDLSTLNSQVTQTKEKNNSEIYTILMDSIDDSASKEKIKNIWHSGELKLNETNADSLVSNIILYSDSIKQYSLTMKDSGKLLLWKENIRKIRKLIKVSPLVDIPGISASSYFKFSIIVSLLAFICGYDPTRFNSFLANIPLLSKKEMDKKKNDNEE